VAVRHGRRPVLVDCATVVEGYEEWTEDLADDVTRGEPPVVIIRHADALTGDGLQRLASLLTGWQGAPPDQAPAWVVVTLGDEPAGFDTQGCLMPFFAHTVEVPPLRHRLD